MENEDCVVQKQIQSEKEVSVEKRRKIVRAVHSSQAHTTTRNAPDQRGAVLEQFLGAKNVVFDIGFGCGIVKVDQHGLVLGKERQNFIHRVVLGSERRRSRRRCSAADGGRRRNAAGCEKGFAHGGEESECESSKCLHDWNSVRGVSLELSGRL